MTVTEYFYHTYGKSITSGFFIEIGVYNGKTQNTTKVLEWNGWKGLLVEPVPQNCAKIKKNRKTPLIEGAVWKEDGYVEIIDIGIPGQTGIKESHRHTDKIINTIKVRSYKFSSLPIPKHINYLQIDTEGSELEILGAIDLSEYQIDYICIEDNLAWKSNDTTYHNFMTSIGYEKIYNKDQDTLYKKL